MSARRQIMFYSFDYYRRQFKFLKFRTEGFQTTEESSVKKYVYFFGAGKAEGKGDAKDLLGGKGAGLAEMTRIGLPVPGGFTITTETCDYYLKHDYKYPKELRA